MSNNDELDIYISCSKKDQFIVEHISSRLRDIEVKCWYALRTVLLAFKQFDAINAAIEKCHAIIVVVSSSYNREIYCHSDIQVAYEKGKPIIVFLIENVELPETLVSIFSRAVRRNRHASVVPINAWEQPLDKSIETLLQIVLVSLERTEEQSQFNETLSLGYYYNHSKSVVSPKSKLKVFLCHSSSDKPAVENFYNILVNDGIDAWLDKKNLIPGQSWQVEIPKAVRNSDVVIVFLSSRSVTKEGFVQKEIKIALDAADEKPEGTVFIVPAKLETCEVPERLAKFQWVDLFENDGYERLFRALQFRASSLNIVVNRKTNTQ